MGTAANRIQPGAPRTVFPDLDGESALEWERRDGEAPEGSGICLSGGGLRAAAFSLGVLQALQDRAELLFGGNCARHLAAVSGGSYIAASYALAGKRRAEAPDLFETTAPFAPSSPEEQHVLNNAQYLRRGAPRLFGFVLVNLAALFVLFGWYGTFIGSTGLVVGVVGDLFLTDLAPIGQLVHPLELPVLSAALALATWTYWAAVYAFGLRSKRTLAPGIVVVFLTGPVVGDLASHANWQGPAFAVALGAVAGSVAIAWLANRLGAGGLAATASKVFVIMAPRVLAAVVLAVVAVWWYLDLARSVMSEDVGTAWGALARYFIALLLGALFSYVPHRASLHREYRDLLASCFGVIRGDTGEAELSGDAPLSTLAPPDGDRRHPRLLVCTTANVRTRQLDGETRWYVPFVMSHGQCGVPSDASAAVSTTQLESIDVPTAFGREGSENLVSLFTAVAAAGAALSPFMGRDTQPTLRLLCAAFNVRLGRWLPNITQGAIRARVEAAAGRRPLTSWVSEGKVLLERFIRWFWRSFRWPNLKMPILDNAMGPGFNELVPELLGLQGPGMYLTDGGHYDNLGLLALLRTKPKQIWCIDSSPDPEGAATELKRVLAIAEAELEIATTGIDWRDFQAQPDGLYTQTHAVGQVTYRDKTMCELIILKLGLTPESNDELLAIREADGRFPWHPTWLQWYTGQRMDAYRRVGWDVATRSFPFATLPRQT
jgi:hypothetical protein